MGRLLPSGSIVRDQLDFYSPPGSFVRLPGVSVSQLNLAAFYNNAPVLWPLVDGSSTLDSSIVSGSFYFNAIPGALGYYSLRYYPDKVGYWRVVVYDTVSGSEQVRDYDITTAVQSSALNTGLIASFTK